MKVKQKLCASRRKKLILRATKAETIFRGYLEQKGVYNIFQKGFIAGNGFYIVDFYLPKPHKICIEIDGSVHDSREQKEKDRRKDEYLKKRGFRVIRFTNEEIFTCLTKLVERTLIDYGILQPF